MKPPYDISNGRETLTCYSGLYASTGDVFAPRTIEELRRVLAYARASHRRVTFRAAGHSFDGQALGDDVVISLAAMKTIEVLRDANNSGLCPDHPDRMSCCARLCSKARIRVGPGASWGDILAALEPFGLVPAVTVTTAKATAGGTLSGDCLSRFSPAYGKEGEWIESFDLVTVDGTLLTCVPPRKGVAAPDLSLEERAFCGVIGGLGYLGAVVSITYRVLRVGETDAQIGVRTKVRKFTTFRDLAKDLVPIAKETGAQNPNPKDPSKLDAIYSALFVGDGGEPYALLFRSHFTPERFRRPMPLHQPDLAVRPLVEWAMRWSRLARWAWPVFFHRLYEDGEEYVDDLEGFTFFMDGNARAKALAARFDVHLRTVQQTFIVPSGPGTKGGWDAAEDDLVEWLEYAAKYFHDRGLYPTLHDVLYLPADGRFLMSATADLAGFAVSYAFETNDESTIAAVKEAFSELADVLWEKFQGRVYLVKNVFAKPSTLRAMYGFNAVEFFSLKRELDPGLVIRNDFLERNFGELLTLAPPRVVRTMEAVTQ